MYLFTKKIKFSKFKLCRKKRYNSNMKAASVIIENAFRFIKNGEY
jgi:hypothetical protein